MDQVYVNELNILVLGVMLPRLLMLILYLMKKLHHPTRSSTSTATTGSISITTTTVAISPFSSSTPSPRLPGVVRMAVSDSQETLELLEDPAWGLEDAAGRADWDEEVLAGAAHEEMADEAAGQASAHQATPLANPPPPDKPPPTPTAEATAQVAKRARTGRTPPATAQATAQAAAALATAGE